MEVSWGYDGGLMGVRWRSHGGMMEVSWGYDGGAVYVPLPSR